MLILTRKRGDRIAIGQNVELVIQKISPSRVTIGILAPDDVRIQRGEMTEQQMAALNLHDLSS